MMVNGPGQNLSQSNSHTLCALLIARCDEAEDMEGDMEEDMEEDKEEDEDEDGEEEDENEEKSNSFSMSFLSRTWTMSGSVKGRFLASKIFNTLTSERAFAPSP